PPPIFTERFKSAEDPGSNRNTRLHPDQDPDDIPIADSVCHSSQDAAGERLPENLKERSHKEGIRGHGACAAPEAGVELEHPSNNRERHAHAHDLGEVCVLLAELDEIAQVLADIETAVYGFRRLFSDEIEADAAQEEEGRGHGESEGVVSRFGEAPNLH